MSGDGRAVDVAPGGGGATHSSLTVNVGNNCGTFRPPFL